MNHLFNFLHSYHYGLVDLEDWWVNKSRKRYKNIKVENNVCEERLIYENLDNLTKWLDSLGLMSHDLG